MWQISWILGLIPEFIWTILLYGSLVAIAATYILKFIKPIAIYATIIRPIAIIIAFFSVYWQGGIDIEHKWQEKVKEAEAKVEQTQQESKRINEELEKERKKKNKVIREYAVTVQEKIIEKEKIINADCKVSPEAVKILNDAAKGPNKDNK